MGILFKEGKRWYVYEATGPVKLTPWSEWIGHGEHDSYSVRRLVRQRLLAQEVTKLRKACDVYKGKPYDPYFGWSNDKIYCSELVWKAYKSGLGIELARPRSLSTFDLSPPPVRKKLKERYGSQIPLNEKAVSPADIFESPLLEAVR